MMIKYNRKQVGSVVSISVQNHLGLLLDVISKLRGVNKHPAHKIFGMFFRSGDLESSYHHVSSAFTAEAGLALEYIGKNFESEKFREDASKRHVALSSYHSGKGWDQAGDTMISFDSRELSPLLRHYINDYCRVLEPLVSLMAEKHPDVDAYDRSKVHFISFNSYVKRLEKRNMLLPFDSQFIKSFYDELWNDYKHSSSPGPKASGWTINSSTIVSSPRVISHNNKYFQDMKVEEFLNKSLIELNTVLDYLSLKNITQQP